MRSRHGLDQRVAARAIWKKADSDEDVLAAWAGGRWETGFTAFAMGGLAPSASSVVGVGRVRSSQLAARSSMLGCTRHREPSCGAAGL